MYIHAVNLELTFADLRAFKPPVINISVADTSAILIPSTARSATTDSTGFLERAALRAPRGNNWHVRRLGDWCVGCYQLSVAWTPRY